jgi:hypothetical protein
MYSSNSDRQYQPSSDNRDPEAKKSTVDLVPVGSYNKIVVDDREVLVVSPNTIDRINQQQRALRDQLAELQARHQRLLQNYNNLIKTVARLEREMENKVSYD